jgi:hypothetical protein
MRLFNTRYITPLIVVLGFLAISLGGCSLPTNLMPEAQLPVTITQPPTLTEAPPTITSTPTITPSPTISVVPSATTRPTLRPTWTQQPSSTPLPTWTPTMTFTPLPTSKIGIVYEEDFSDSSGPWQNDSGSNWEIGYGDGDYRMLVTEPLVEITATRTFLYYADARIQADVFFREGVGYYGFSCRENVTGYYIGFITDDGKYGVGERRGTYLDFMRIAPSDAVNTGRNVKNRVAMECRGNFINLYVNDVWVVSERVEGIGPGFISLMIGTRDSDYLEVDFDNLVVWGPAVEE